MSKAEGKRHFETRSMTGNEAVNERLSRYSLSIDSEIIPSRYYQLLQWLVKAKEWKFVKPDNDSKLQLECTLGKHTWVRSIRGLSHVASIDIVRNIIDMMYDKEFDSFLYEVKTMPANCPHPWSVNGVCIACENSEGAK